MSPDDIRQIVLELLDGRANPATDHPLSVDEAAEYLGIRPGKLNELRMTGGGPEYYRIGRRVFYRRVALDKFIDENTHSHTAEYIGRSK